MSKFKLGDTIFFMKDNVPKSAIIKGIATYQGVTYNSTSEKQTPVGELSIEYHTAMFESVLEEKAFPSLPVLIKSVFPEIKDFRLNND